MGHTICHHKGWYFIWSSIVDAPITKAYKIKDFRDCYQIYEGTDGFAARTQRARLKGTSSLHSHETAKEFVAYNRAGPSDTCLSWEALAEYLEIPKEDW